MNDKRRIENIVEITDTLWQLNKAKRIQSVEETTKQKVPEDCIKFAEFMYRAGALDMEKALGKDWRNA